MAESLASANLPAREDAEPIVLWIPRWNIETWLLYLSGTEVDEDHDFKHRLKKVDWKQVAQRFVDDFRRTRNQEAVETLPSLNAAFEETCRLPT